MAKVHLLRRLDEELSQLRMERVQYWLSLRHEPSLNLQRYRAVRALDLEEHFRSTPHQLLPRTPNLSQAQLLTEELERG